MSKRFYTLDDLYAFCKNNNFTSFSSKTHGKPLVVHSIETFESNGNCQDGFLDVKLKSCHVGKNRNGSSISEKVMDAHKNTFKGRPILGAIHKTESGEYEFHAHDIIVNEDDEFECIEQPIGAISEIKEPYLEYDKEQDKTYLMVEGHIYEDYSRAAEILQRRRTCKCSVEISVDEMSYNADEDYLSIDAFSFRGVTILGYEQDGETEIQEGMEGSKITIDSFSAETNSMFSAKLIETLEKLNNTLSKFAINTDKEKGVSGMDYINELLTKYNKTQDDITFDYTEMSDEELDAKFAELFDEDGDEAAEETAEEPAVEEPAAEDDEPEADPASEEDEGDDEEEPAEDDDSVGKKNEDFEINFKISHEDTRYGIQNLLSAQNGDSHYYVVNSVYDGYFYYEDWYTMDAFKQNYKTRKNSISFSGDPIPVFREFVTQEEKDELESMRKNYAELKEFKEQYDATQLHAQREAVLASEEYSVLTELDEFKELVTNMDQYSVEDLTIKADLAFAKFAKTQGEFAARGEKKPKVLSFRSGAEKEPKKGPYGNLFSKK